MKRVSLYVGIALFVIFLWTGQYMKTEFVPIHLNDGVMRAQIRASHIYLLLVALLNILSAWVSLRSSWQTYTDMTFRVLLMGAGSTALYAFAQEHTGNPTERTWTLVTMILSLSAVGVLVLSESITAWYKDRP